MTAGQLKKELVNVPDDAEVVFQGNEQGEDGHYDYTVSTGFLDEVFLRGGVGGGEPDKHEFVLDCAITGRIE